MENQQDHIVTKPGFALVRSLTCSKSTGYFRHLLRSKSHAKFLDPNLREDGRNVDQLMALFVCTESGETPCFCPPDNVGPTVFSSTRGCLFAPKADGVDSTSNSTNCKNSAWTVRKTFSEHFERKMPQTWHSGPHYNSAGMLSMSQTAPMWVISHPIEPHTSSPFPLWSNFFTFQENSP